ncbi:fasciclin domain-containing protein [Phenylobacterium sp.]|uniref:fasciclin domain-containing protein n=1 Tax=Phenylobacterium sp. TaxID=1871053 RepID=UPI001224D9E3|nr:fasciclin domain-containing protein [Phenylobacterium sp.]THD51318.1 MAG: fasciclin domain-containing protein [Phenylobacterium sp.]
MPIHRLLTAAAAVSLLAGAAVAQTPPPAAAPPAASTAAVAKLVPNGDLSNTLRASPNFTVFTKALDATNLSSLLKSSPGLTVFAPTDAAFPQSKLDSMMSDKPGLQKFLLHYIINAKIDSSKIKGAHGGLPSGAGDKIVVDGTAADGTLKADNATIIQSDVMASNGVIHVVDALMVAGSVPETLPEPPPEAAAAAPEPAPAAPPTKKKK